MVKLHIRDQDNLRRMELRINPTCMLKQAESRFYHRPERS